MPKKPKAQTPEPFSLHFGLDEALPETVHTDPRVEALRRQLAALLDLVVLTQNGQMVQVDGFKLVSELESAPEQNYVLFASRKAEQ